MDKDVERISFRLKDLLTVIQKKETDMRIFYNDNEIDYDYCEDYRNYYVVDIWIGTNEEEEVCLNVKVNESVELVYYPKDLT